MKKSILALFFLSLFFFSGCDFDWGPPECTYEENFKFKGNAPDINLANSDSVIIDMSKYWTAKAACNSYTPIIKRAKGNRDLVELRTIDEFLIIKGLQKGETEISVFAEKRNATFDTADCHTFSTSAGPISFKVRINESTSYKSDKMVKDVNNRILSFKITPSNFSKGDTVLIKFDAENPKVSSSAWYSESGTFISNESLSSDCRDEYVVANSRQVEMVVETDSNFIEGYAHIDFAKIKTQMTGTNFYFISENLSSINNPDNC